MPEDKYIILLDGSKGAGKTTVSELLRKQLPNLECLSVDTERRILEAQEEGWRARWTRTERNQKAFDVILKKTEECLGQGMNVVIDCGWIEKRILAVEAIAERNKAKVYKFLLHAPHGVLLDRVRARDAAKGWETNVERFDEIHKHVYAKEFTDFSIIETETLKPEEIAEKIIHSIK